MSDEPEINTTDEETTRLVAEKAKLAEAHAERDKLQKQSEENVKEMLKTWPGARDEQAHKLSQVLAEHKRLLKEKQYAQDLNTKAKKRRDELDIERLEARHMELIESIDKQKSENKDRSEAIKIPYTPSKEDDYEKRHKTTADHHSELLSKFKHVISELGDTNVISEQHKSDFKSYNDDILYWATQNYRHPHRNQPRPVILVRYARTLMAAITGNKNITLMQREAYVTTTCYLI